MEYTKNTAMVKLYTIVWDDIDTHHTYSSCLQEEGEYEFTIYDFWMLGSGRSYNVTLNGILIVQGEGFR